MQKMNIEWPYYSLGIIILAVQGVLAKDHTVLCVFTYLVGWSLLLKSLYRNGMKESSAALMLIVGTNAAFWASFLGWMLLRDTRVSHPEGIDPYAFVLSLWLLAFVLVSIYEMYVLLRGLVKKVKVYPCVGLLCLVAQVCCSVGYIWQMVSGV